MRTDGRRRCEGAHWRSRTLEEDELRAIWVAAPASTDGGELSIATEMGALAYLISVAW